MLLIRKERNGHTFDKYVNVTEKSIVVGRGNCDLVSDDSFVSRVHLEIRKRGEDIVIKDLDSTNGTKIDGIKIPTMEEVVAPKGSTILIGKSTRIVVLKEPTDITTREVASCEI